MEPTDKKNWYFNPIPRMVRDQGKDKEELTSSIRTTNPEEWIAFMQERGELIFCETMKARMTKNHCRAIHKKIMDDDASYLSYEVLLKCRRCNNE